MVVKVDNVSEDFTTVRTLVAGVGGLHSMAHIQVVLHLSTEVK